MYTNFNSLALRPCSLNPYRVSTSESRRVPTPAPGVPPQTPVSLFSVSRVCTDDIQVADISVRSSSFRYASQSSVTRCRALLSSNYAHFFVAYLAAVPAPSAAAVSVVWRRRFRCIGGKSDASKAVCVRRRRSTVAKSRPLTTLSRHDAGRHSCSCCCCKMTATDGEQVLLLAAETRK